VVKFSVEALLEKKYFCDSILFNFFLKVKIGAVTHSSSNRGLIAEISYSSATSNQDAYGVVFEFMQSVFGWTNISEMITSFVRRKPSGANYTPEDTIVQYFEHFNNFRSQQQRA
jgi:hypothetical protein